MSGQLETLKAKFSDKVTKGQWLAEIDPVISENALRQARASEESPRAQQKSTAAQLTQAELAFHRQQTLLRDDATSRESFKAARAALDLQRATLASLAAQIRSARIQIETAQVDQQQRLRDTQSAYELTRLNRLNNRMTLYRALGGGTS